MGKFNLMDLLNTQQSGQAEPPQVSEREETQPRKPAYKIVALSVFDLVPSEGNFYSIADAMGPIDIKKGATPCSNLC